MPRTKRIQRFVKWVGAAAILLAGLFLVNFAIGANFQAVTSATRKATLTPLSVFATQYGPYFPVLATVMAGIHFVRRRVWKGESPLKDQADASVQVERQTLGILGIHWLHVALISTFMVTGLSMISGSLLFEPYTLQIHISTAYLIAFVDFPIYLFFLRRGRELRYIGRISKQDLKDVWVQSLNFVGLSRAYPEHATYSPKEGGYHLGKKYCSLQKFLFYSNLICLILFGFTGLSMYYRMTFPVVAMLVGGFWNLLALHLLVFYYFIATLIGHFYLSFIPANWGMLRAMVLRKGRIGLHA